MTTYNFDEIIPRRGTCSYKWDSAQSADVLPMWVADMDFRTAPCVIDALMRRVKHGIFGYTRVTDDYYNAVIHWFGSRHGWKISHEMILYTSGVVPALSAVIKAMTNPGDKVLLQTPVYNCFFSSIRNNGCQIVDSPLIKDGESYLMDFDDLEIKAADPGVKLMLLCNPHNPVGRVWHREELLRLNDICMRNGVKVISDEIHCELVFPGYKFHPFASLSKACMDNSVICNSPSKSFNIAGLQIANIISADEQIRKDIDKALNINEVCDVNPFGVDALIAAYNEGSHWLEELKKYIYDNYLCLLEFFNKYLPMLKVTKMEGTYLVWVDCTALSLGSYEIEHRLLESQKLWLNSGNMYGSDQFMRINIACPRSVMLEGLGRFREFVTVLNIH